MINKIIDLLNRKKDISAWTLTETRSSSKELFFIKEKLDINRATDIHEYSLRIFVDFEEDGEKYKGDSAILLSSTDSLDEVEEKIDVAIFSSSFVKNKWYDLPENDGKNYIKITKYSNLSDLEDKYDDLYKLLYKDYGFTSKMNSAEIFAIEREKRVLTSKGVDVTYPNSEFTFEIVTDSNSGQEPVEIFRDYSLTNIDLEKIEEIVKAQLEETDGRSKATRNKKIENIRTILVGDAVEEFLSFYVYQASDNMIYNKISKFESGKNFLGEDAKEKLNIRLNPSLESSTFAVPVDPEGKRLEAYTLYEDGVCRDIRSSSRFSHYLGIENKGTVNTFEVEAGDLSLEDYKKEDYIEILAFSSFLMDPVTGDFGGEFRLARYVHDGVEEYITGGAISENIFKRQKEMRFSKEKDFGKLSSIPKAVIFDNVNVSGE